MGLAELHPQGAGPARGEGPILAARERDFRVSSRRRRRRPLSPLLEPCRVRRPGPSVWRLETGWAWTEKGRRVGARGGGCRRGETTRRKGKQNYESSHSRAGPGAPSAALALRGCGTRKLYQEGGGAPSVSARLAHAIHLVTSFPSRFGALACQLAKGARVTPRSSGAFPSRSHISEAT